MTAFSVVFLSILLIAVALRNVEKDSIIEGTKLELAFVIVRHGDRTPIKESLRFIKNSVDMDKVAELVEPWGWGQLTEKGKQRGFKTGEFIRRRYNEQLSWKYNRSEIYIRSTDSTRAKMTVLTALSAIYPAVGNTWNPLIAWVPVPYTTLPAKYDCFLYLLNCPTFMEVHTKLMLAPSAAMVKDHANLLANLTQILGLDLMAHPALTYNVFDVLSSLVSLGYELGSKISDLMLKLKDTAGDAMDIIYGSEEYLDLASGPILNEFFSEAEKVITGEETQKLHIYYAHDVNVYGFEAVTGVVNKQGVPGYGALYSLELRRVVETGEYVVLPVYLQTPEMPEVYLQLEGCESYLCPYETFHSRTSTKAISETNWRERCNWSEDIIVDSESIA